VIMKNEYSIYEGISGEGMRVRVMAKSIAEAEEVSGKGSTLHLVEKLPNMELI